MKLLSLLCPALLALTANAADSEPVASQASSAASKVASKASSAASSSTPEPTPTAQFWTPYWTPSNLSTTAWTRKCASTSTYRASIYKLGEMYPALKDYAAELKIFYHLQHYPGSWNGEDKHGNDRELMKMELAELPFAVREWLKNKQEKVRWYNVQDDVVFFAPGAIYPIMPLFVEEAEGAEMGECEGVFDDLENYSREPKDGAVIARVEHKAAGKNEVEFTVEAMQVFANAEKNRDEL